VRVVIETNVLVSGVINPHGAPGRIVDAVLAEALIVLYDDRILSEYRAVLLRPRFQFQPREVDAFLDFVEWSGEAVAAKQLAVKLPDASALPFLEVAAAGRADWLVTGKHLRLPRISGHIYVCMPREFMREFGRIGT
jgi:uncharacterized protein